jgi:hypothetical protein
MIERWWTGEQHQVLPLDDRPFSPWVLDARRSFNRARRYVYWPQTAMVPEAVAVAYNRSHTIRARSRCPRAARACWSRAASSAAGPSMWTGASTGPQLRRHGGARDPERRADRARHILRCASPRPPSTRGQWRSSSTARSSARTVPRSRPPGSRSPGGALRPRQRARRHRRLSRRSFTGTLRPSRSTSTGAVQRSRQATLAIATQ